MTKPPCPTCGHQPARVPASSPAPTPREPGEYRHRGSVIRWYTAAEAAAEDAESQRTDQRVVGVAVILITLIGVFAYLDGVL